jgi:hypothetical protein
MNNGLPSLLDAIFGKQDMDSVSLEEMYELINEFPSFNAGHFLLSRKLKQMNEAAYEKETMRTALYFNNPFWLQSVLNEDHYEVAKKTEGEYSGNNGEGNSITDNFEKPEPAYLSEPPEGKTVVITEQFYVQEEYFEKDVLTESSVSDERTFENITEKETALQEAQSAEKLPDDDMSLKEESSSVDFGSPVRSFDDLILKYQVELQEQVSDVLPANSQEPETKPSDESPVNEQADEEMVIAKEEFQNVDKEITDRGSENLFPEEGSGSYEVREEIINEYGIFEEVIVKKADFDFEAFDRPDSTPATPPVESEHIIPVTEPPKERKWGERIVEEEIPKPATDHIAEISLPEQSVKTPAEADYEAFDRPIDKKPTEDLPEESAYDKEIIADEESITEIYSGQENRMDNLAATEESDDTGNAGFTSAEEDNSVDVVSPGLAERFSEHRKSIPPFDPKKAESIVFAPYHMIDYFASQGIKLVMEENPADNFGKQLKSFTDWLKVMKKLPVQSISEKPDEKDVDRIRHFAAHSIDEREILTESMAEVLAKQGMYENAIALYQKLSLIYPPKSAYFASRIEQLKASLP